VTLVWRARELFDKRTAQLRDVRFAYDPRVKSADAATVHSPVT